MVRDILTKNRYTNFYNPDGTPAWEVDGASGKRVKVTVVHARKLGLLPSVTNILSILRKEALEDWKQEQLVRACLDLQRGDTESEHDYVNRVVDKAFSKSETAKDFGSECHYFIQDVLQGKERAEYDLPELTIIAIRNELKKHIVTAVCEKPLVSAGYGYAGRSDCRSIGHDGVATRWEFKTQGTKTGEKIKTYDEWLMQVAAYDHIEPSGAWKALVVSSTEPGRVEIYDYAKDDVNKAFQAFLGLLAAFKFIKKI